VMDKIGRERGWSPLTRQAYDASLTRRGAAFVGSPHEIVERSSSSSGRPATRRPGSRSGRPS
jgi:hypothetical protein